MPIGGGGGTYRRTLGFSCLQYSGCDLMCSVFDACALSKRARHVIRLPLISHAAIFTGPGFEATKLDPIRVTLALRAPTPVPVEAGVEWTLSCVVCF